MRLQLRSSLVKPAKKVIGKQRLTVLVNVSSPAPYPQREPVTTGSLFILCFNESQSAALRADHALHGADSLWVQGRACASVFRWNQRCTIWLRRAGLPLLQKRIWLPEVSGVQAGNSVTRCAT